MASRTSHRTWRNQRAEILDESDTCWLCGHGGSDSVDHKLPVASGGTDDRWNLAPAHLKACPTCGRKCNLQKGSKVNSPVVAVAPSRKWY